MDSQPSKMNINYRAGRYRMCQKILSIVMGAFIAIGQLQAQTQQGFVKTIGRPGNPGVPLENVTIQMERPVLWITMNTMLVVFRPYLCQGTEFGDGMNRGLPFKPAADNANYIHKHQQWNSSLQTLGGLPQDMSIFIAE